MIAVMEDRSQEYDAYLRDHISNVNRAWKEYLRPVIEDNAEYSQYLPVIDKEIENHDASKYNDDEYTAYLNHFYPENKEEIPKVDIDFDLAWLTHMHRNPHHWQYWILRRDSGEVTAMNMPIEHVCNMLCDWHSFSANDPDSTAEAWYNEHGDEMTLSDGTREIIDELIGYLSEPLK